MLVIATLHNISETVDTRSGDIRTYLEFLHSDPLKADKVNISNATAQLRTDYEKLMGQKVIIGLDFRKTDNGIPYSMITQQPRLFQTKQAVDTKPVVDTKPAANASGSMFGKTANA
ncbi:MAG: hypothetical protein Q8L68_07750 [Methylococcales bacterium]|nr:hypothetical protein [Methylococcales bacterium]